MCVVFGNFGRTPLYQKFCRRQRDPDEEKVRGREQRKQFRLKWTQGVYDAAVEERKKLEHYTESHVADGVYLSFDAIVERQGGRHNVANIRAAQSYCATCMERGHTWVAMNEFTKRLEFLYVEHKTSQTWGTSWQRARTETRVTKALAKDVAAAGKSANQKAVKSEIDAYAPMEARSNPNVKQEGQSAQTRVGGHTAPKERTVVQIGLTRKCTADQHVSFLFGGSFKGKCWNPHVLT